MISMNEAVAMASGNEYIFVVQVEAFQGQAESVTWANVHNKPDLAERVHNHASDVWLINLIEQLRLSLAHPATHPASMIVEDSERRFLSDLQIDAFNNKAELSDIETAITALKGSSSEALDTLKEIGDALGNDPNFATSMINLIGSKVSQLNFDSHTNDGGLHVDQTLKTRFTEIDNWVQLQSTLIGALDSNRVFKKTTSKSWKALWEEVVDSGIANLNGFKIRIDVDDIEMSLEDYVFNSPAWKNGLIEIRPSDYAQKTVLLSDRKGYWNFRGTNLIVLFRGIEFKFAPGGSGTMVMSQYNDIHTRDCVFNAKEAEVKVSPFLMGSGNMVSVGDTFQGNETVDLHETSIVAYGAGIEQIEGGKTTIINAKSDSKAFTYGIEGKGSVIAKESAKAFIHLDSQNASSISRRSIVVDADYNWVSIVGSDYENCDLIIKYSFDLLGETITLPSNCKLIFKGGKFLNGALVLNETLFDAHQDVSILTDVVVSGYLVNDVIFTKWFENDDEANSNMITAIDNLGKGKTIEFTKDKQYTSTKGISFLTGSSSNTIINANGATVSLDAAFTSSFIRMYAEIKSTTAVNIDVVENTHYIDLSSKPALYAAVKKGDCLYLDGEYTFVRELIDNKAVLFHPIIETRTITSISHRYSSKNVEINNLNIKTNNTEAWGIAVTAAFGLRMKGCTLNGEAVFGKVGATLQGADIFVWNNKLYNFYDPALGNGYGVSVQGSNIYIEDNEISKCKHVIVYGGNYGQNVQYKRNILSSNYDFETAHNTHLVDFHWGCKGGVISDNIITAPNCSHAIYVRSADKGITISNNEIIGNSIAIGSDNTDSTKDICVKGNKFIPLDGSIDNAINLINVATNVEISDNIDCDINLEEGVTDLNIYGNTIKDSIHFSSTSSPHTNVRLCDNIFKDSITGLVFQSDIINLDMHGNTVDCAVNARLDKKYTNWSIYGNSFNNSRLYNVDVPFDNLTNVDAFNNKTLDGSEFTNSIFDNMPMCDAQPITGLTTTTTYRLCKFDNVPGAGFTRTMQILAYNTYLGGVYIELLLNTQPASNKFNMQAIAKKANAGLTPVFSYIYNDANDTLEIFISGVNNYKILSSDVLSCEKMLRTTAETVFTDIPIEYLL